MTDVHATEIADYRGRVVSMNGYDTAAVGDCHGPWMSFTLKQEALGMPEPGPRPDVLLRFLLETPLIQAAITVVAAAYVSGELLAVGLDKGQPEGRVKWVQTHKRV